MQVWQTSPVEFEQQIPERVYAVNSRLKAFEEQHYWQLTTTPLALKPSHFCGTSYYELTNYDDQL